MLSAIRLTETALDEDGRPLLNGSPEQVAGDLLQFGKVGLEHLVGTPTMRGETQLERVLRGMEFMAAELLPAFQ